MARKQLIALLVCFMGIYIVGFMVFTLFPVYAVQLGMEEGAMGVAFALVWAAITVSTLGCAWLSDRFQRRKLTMIIASAVGIPATFLIGQVGNAVPLILFTMLVWFVGGLGIGMVTILTGLHVAPDARGRVFGLLVSAFSLGSALGSFAAGPIVERWGFTGLFTITALVWLIPLVAACFLDDSISTRPAEGAAKSVAVSLSRSVWLLIVANILVSVSTATVLLTRPLKMNGLAYDANSIASATGISGLVGIPLPFLVGWISDRMGRKQLIVAGFVLTGAGTLLLVSAVELWQFWLSASLITLGGSIGGVANAFITDLAPQESLSTALARFNATPAIGGIFGFGLSGFFIQSMGLSPVLLISGLLPFTAIALLTAVRRNVRLAPA